jgi:glycosyltransferase involved in cell wall biosynthesis
VHFSGDFRRMENPTYIVITPARDEELHIQKTIRSMVSQTRPPAQWVIVDDGSRDRTGPLCDTWAEKVDWITTVHRPDRGSRNSAGGEIDAFYAGFRAVTVPSWEFVVKLDGDLSFDPDYFERCLQRFSSQPRLGIGGGEIYNVIGLRYVTERNPRFHVRGAVKMYRRACFERIGGLVNRPGWDTLDEVTANYLGWNTQTFDGIAVYHHRVTGGAAGPWRNAVKNGLCNYTLGYHPAFMALKCVKRVSERPYLVKSIGLAWGFTKGYLRRMPQVDDKRIISYVRSQQLNRLLRRETVWK